MKIDNIKSLPCETWKIIPNTQDRYVVSSKGRIVSLWRIKGKGISKTPKLLNQYSNDQGYRYVYLYTYDDNNRYVSKEYSVHRLVAANFIDNPENKSTVNHKDGDKSNNCVDNLEWATQSENNKHAYLTGLNSNHLEYNIQKKAVVCIETGQEWPSLAQASYSVGFKYSYGLQYTINKGTAYKGNHYRYKEDN